MKNLVPFSFINNLPRFADKDVFDEFDRWVDSFWRNRQTDPVIRFAPAVDIDETENSFFVTFDMPGIRKEDLRVEVDGTRLTVSGERKYEKQQDDRATRYHERSFGRFERTFTLPQVVDAEQIQAQYRDGILQVILPKSERAKARTVEVQSAQSSTESLGSSSTTSARTSGSERKSENQVSPSK